MALPSWLSAAGGNFATANGADPNVPYPTSGFVAGDLFLLFLFMNQSDGTVATPDGWTLIYDDTGLNGSAFVFAKKAAGTETGSVTVDVTVSAGILVIGCINTVRDWNDTGTITDAFEGNATNSGTGTTDTHATLTTLGADRLVVAWRWFNNSIANSVDDYVSGGSETWTGRREQGTTTGNNGTVRIDTCDVASADTIDGGTDTITSVGWANRVFAIKPVGGTNATVSGVAAGSTAAVGAPPKPRPEHPFSEVNVRL